MRDSNAAIKSKPPALWLGTLGYLVAVEQVGHCIQLKSEPQRSGQGSVQSFVAAAREFGDSGPFPRGDTDRKLLYAVRSALAHEYGLFNDKKRFTYARGNQIFTPTSGQPTVVCLDAIWTFVTDLVANVRTQHAQSNVALVGRMTPEKLMQMRFVVQN